MNGLANLGLIQMTVVYDDREVREVLDRLDAELRDQRRLYREAATLVRDYMRQTITLQGRQVKWARLSKWTRARTGRVKALLPLRPMIKAKWDNHSGTVYFEPKGNYTLEQHDKGYIIPAVKGKRMVIPSKNGGIFAIIMSRKRSFVPARPIIPSQIEGGKIIHKAVVDYARRMTKHV